VNENRNLILAIALSLLVLVGWGMVSEYYFPTSSQPSTKIENGKQVAQPQPNQLPTGMQETPRTIRDRGQVLRETQRVAIDTPSLRGSINLAGARIDDLVLVRHTETIANNSEPVRLFSPAGTQGSAFAVFGWQGQNVALPNAQTVWQASAPRLAPGNPVTLRWDNGQGQTFEIRLAVDENYLFTAEQHVINRGAAPVAVQPFTYVSRLGPAIDPHSWQLHLGPVGVFSGTADYDNSYTNLAEQGQRRFASRGGWLGFGDQYWLAAIIPAQGAQVDAGFRHNPGTNGYQAEATIAPHVVQPGRGMAYTSHVFAGAKEVRLLDAYGDTLGTPLDRAIDWGWFEFFMHPIFALLMWLFDLIGNFGWAIIGLVVIVRLLLFPIAQKQFQSFAKMRVVQPKMKALQERYKDDKAKLQEETLRLYREEKVNPAAGCLPILLQIPIFYGLYRTLTLSVEMRHQPWVLWIEDLSAPDPLTPINLFGLLPFTPPSFLLIGVLPIVVGVTMWLQQKLSPQAPDPVQRQVFALMPWVLMVIMAPFAAGLQLYWATNNILSIAQMKWLYSRNPALNDSSKTAAPSPAPEPTPAPASPSLAKSGNRRKPKPKGR
jgi:YidC/Oxa1 family membrane protein insertase